MKAFFAVISAAAMIGLFCFFITNNGKPIIGPSPHEDDERAPVQQTIELPEPLHSLTGFVADPIFLFPWVIGMFILIVVPLFLNAILCAISQVEAGTAVIRAATFFWKCWVIGPISGIILIVEADFLWAAYVSVGENNVGACLMVFMFIIVPINAWVSWNLLPMLAQLRDAVLGRRN